MIKHVGKHNDRKVAILFRTVPNEEHMCLLVYSDLLPRLIHDSIMSTLESAPGQQADNLADVLFRTLMSDGRNVLEVIHKEGFMKKVPTSQVIMTPTQAASIRLDELNSLLSEMAKGEDAIKRMAEIDASKGLQTKKSNLPEVKPTTENALQAPMGEALTDEAIANQQRAQAARMKAEAASLLAEAERLESEANVMAPVPKAATVKTTKPKATATKTTKKAPVKNDVTEKAKKA